MAFADPQSFTIAGFTGSPFSLPKVSSSDDAGKFATGDAALIEFISSNYGKRTRRLLKLTHSKYAADVLFPAQNTPYSISASLVLDAGKVPGYTVAEQVAFLVGLFGNLTASSNANLTKFCGGEN